MPFLFRRIRENLCIFLGMGLIYFFAYHKIAKLPESSETVFVSCAGFLLVAMLIYGGFLRSYLLSFEDLVIYVKTNLTAYGVNLVVFCLIFALNAFSGGDVIYSVLLAPYDVLTAFGASKIVSVVFVHIVVLIITVALPCFIREQETSGYSEKF